MSIKYSDVLHKLFTEDPGFRKNIGIHPDDLRDNTLTDQYYNHLYNRSTALRPETIRKVLEFAHPARSRLKSHSAALLEERR